MTQDVSAAIPQILAQGLQALRENAIMPMLVNRGYDPAPGTKGSTVDVTIPSAITANPVVPGATAQAATDLSPTKVQIVLDQWEEAAFTLSDKEVTQVTEGYRSDQITEAIRALVNKVDVHILSKYKGVYGYSGVAGTTPFASTMTEATHARRELARNLAPTVPRVVVLDEDAEASALGNDKFHAADYTGSRDTYVTGFIGEVMGARWQMDQNMPTHTAGTLNNGAAGLPGRIALVNAGSGLAAGVATMNIDNTTLTGTVVEGDVFKFAGHAGTYVVTNTSPLTAAVNAITGLTFAPALRASVANNEEVQFHGSHVVNLFMHRDAFALATRPLSEGMQERFGSIIMAATDPISKLTLRLEVNRQHKQDRWSFDLLWGAALVRPALAARIMG